MEALILEERKKQRKLLFLFVIVVMITFLILYFGYFRKPSLEVVEPELEITIKEKKLEIDPKLLDHPFLKESEEIPQIEKIDPEKLGRENPFLPY